MSKNAKRSRVITFTLLTLASCASQAQSISGTGSLSGSVTAPVEFRAAQVYAMNVDKHIQYVVYTAAGEYRAINLFPGKYEVRVKTKGLESGVKNVVVREGESTDLDFELREVREVKIGDTKYVSYESLYPPGPGREEVERYCVYCHYENYLPARQWTREQWKVGVDLLLNVGGPRSIRHRSVIPDTPHLIASTTISVHPFGDIEFKATNTLGPEDRELILDYLARHFGPDSKKRALAEENNIPVDENILANAMYVEYYVQPNPEVDKEGYVRQVQDPHFDSKGNVWFTDRGTRNRLGRLDPTTGEITDFLMPDTRDLDPHGLTIDKNDDVWWVEEFGMFLGHLDIESGEMERFSLNVDNLILGGLTHTPTLDSKQNVWFSIMSGNHLGKWDRQTGNIMLYKAPLQGTGSYGYGIVADDNDNIWSTTYHRCDVVKFDPVTEKFTDYAALPDDSEGCVMRRLDHDSMGAIWFGVFSHGKLGRIDPVTGQQDWYDLPVPFGSPYATQVDAEDKVWMGDDRTGIVRFDPETEEFTYFPEPRKSSHPKIEITREGAIWFGPRDPGNTRVTVLYPDVRKMTTQAAHY